MRFFHISDLHIGKQLYERSLLEDQRYILAQAAEAVKTYGPDAVVIAGDIYDKPVPSAEAVTVFDEFITALAATGTAVLIVSGNHDSAERLNFGSRLFEKSRVHFAGLPPRTADEHIKKVTLTDKYGEADFWLLPFVKPGYVRGVFKGTESENAADSYDAAVRALLEREEIDPSKRNIIVSHQLYTNGGAHPYRSDSETVNIGGIDNVDIDVLQGFDYAALGHIHRAQHVKSENMRYCGTLLKYSVGEENDKKSLLMVELGAKGEPAHYTEIDLVPLRGVRQITGRFDEITEKYGYSGTSCAGSGAEYTDRTCSAQDTDAREDYVSVLLTDEGRIYDAGGRLSDIFPRLLNIRVQNPAADNDIGEDFGAETILTLKEEFELFFEMMQGRPMSPEEKEAFGKTAGSLETEGHMSALQGNHEAH